MSFGDKFKQWPFDKKRLEAFSDGVFAIVMTILVLELKLPHIHNPTDMHEVWDAILSQKATLFSWAVSFFFIALIWMHHHQILSMATKADYGTTWINIFLIGHTQGLYRWCKILETMSVHIEQTNVHVREMEPKVFKIFAADSVQVFGGEDIVPPVIRWNTFQPLPSLLINIQSVVHEAYIKFAIIVFVHGPNHIVGDKGGAVQVEYLLIRRIFFYAVTICAYPHIITGIAVQVGHHIPAAGFGAVEGDNVIDNFVAFDIVDDDPVCTTNPHIAMLVQFHAEGHEGNVFFIVLIKSEWCILIQFFIEEDHMPLGGNDQCIAIQVPDYRMCRNTRQTVGGNAECFDIHAQQFTCFKDHPDRIVIFDHR